MMKKIVTVLLLILVLAPCALAQQASKTNPDPWPRSVEQNGVKYTVHQPQPDSWDGFTLKARSAVAIQEKKDKPPVYGVIFFEVKTLVDRDNRIVNFEDFNITQAKFPSVPDMAETYLQQFRQALPKKVKSVSLDRMEAGMAYMQQQKKSHKLPLKNDPPKIIFSQRPAILVLVDGEPRYTPIKDTGLVRVVNTRVLMVKDASGTLYLHLFDGWMETKSLKVPWTVLKNVSKDLKTAEKFARESKQADLMEGKDDPTSKKKLTLKTNAPVIYVALEPTELITIQGEPSFVPVGGGTQLLYAKNTTAHIFKHLKNQKTYILLSGRWFSAKSLDGPWTYVTGKELPPDFAMIPDESPKENVKASVPGTHQANEAVIAANIPQTAKIDRKKTKYTPQIDGEPQLKPVEGTPLNYVVNSAAPIIKVDVKEWYACAKGVWFVSKSLKGTWAVADTVPPVIYSIPPSSPIFYVTYVRIYGSTPEFVYVGYTSGYYGSYVTPDTVVVYGTGYHYDSCCTTVWYGYPCTYGYCSSMCYTPWYGWSYGYGYGWWYDYYPPPPYWGPYYGWEYNDNGGVTAWGPGGWASTTGNVYHQWGNTTAVTRGAEGYNAYTGNSWSTKYGMAYNSTTGTLATGRTGSVENVYTGRYASGGKGTVYSPSKDVAVSGKKITVGNENTGREVTAGKITVKGPDGETGSIGAIKGEQGTIGRAGDTTFATKDGNVYVNKGDGWQEVTKPPTGGTSAQTRQQTTQDLDREMQARQVGQQRTQSYNSSRQSGSFNRPSSGSFNRPSMGGSRMGGGRGGGRR